MEKHEHGPKYYNRVGLGVGGALRRPFPQGLPAGVPRRSRALHNAAGAPSAHGGLVPPRLGDRCGQGRAAGAEDAVLRGVLAGREDRGRLRLWNSKFKLRTIQRQLLWRMANARGDETLVFFAVLMTTPWLFSNCRNILYNV
ncbi:GL11916 [Drosophila persimilis]|uniref:GL11916 n=1 Tax=Drosophila persimilis TaxID=7234 RepID=B4HBW2_DROPE|nr:GL11916 [Drosophila persimilis]